MRHTPYNSTASIAVCPAVCRVGLHPSPTPQPHVFNPYKASERVVHGRRCIYIDSRCVCLQTRVVGVCCGCMVESDHLETTSARPWTLAFVATLVVHVLSVFVKWSMCLFDAVLLFIHPSPDPSQPPQTPVPHVSMPPSQHNRCHNHCHHCHNHCHQSPPMPACQQCTTLPTTMSTQPTPLHTCWLRPGVGCWVLGAEIDNPLHRHSMHTAVHGAGVADTRCTSTQHALEQGPRKAWRRQAAAPSSLAPHHQAETMCPVGEAQLAPPIPSLTPPLQHKPCSHAPHSVWVTTWVCWSQPCKLIPPSTCSTNPCTRSPCRSLRPIHDHHTSNKPPRRSQPCSSASPPSHLGQCCCLVFLFHPRRSGLLIILHSRAHLVHVYAHTSRLHAPSNPSWHANPRLPRISFPGLDPPWARQEDRSSSDHQPVRDGTLGRRGWSPWSVLVWSRMLMMGDHRVVHDHRA